MEKEKSSNEKKIIRIHKKNLYLEEIQIHEKRYISCANSSNLLGLKTDLRFDRFF